MMESLKKLFLGRLWKVLLFTVLLVVGLAATFDFYYDLNDDTTIKDIISGAYTGSPSGYSVQMLFPLSFCISLCYRAIPGVPWYGLFLCVCQFGAWVLIAWRATGLVKKQWQQVVALCFETVIFFGLLIRQLVIVQYSVTSGICMATAIFLYLTGEEKETPGQYLKQNIVSILLVILAFMIRTEMCIMLLPFLLLAGFCEWMTQEKIVTVRNVKRYLYLIGAALLGMVAVLSIDRLSIATSTERETWQSFQSFFDERTSLYDFYGIPSYEEHMEFYEKIGLSRESYALLENYNFSMDESINENLLADIVQYQEKMAKTEQGLAITAGFISKNSLSEAIWLYKEQLLNMKSGVYAYILLAAYISFILLAGGRKKSGCYWKIILLLVIRSILWIYLFMVDRALDRITCPLLVTEINVLLGWIIKESIQAKPSAKNFVSVKMQALGAYGLLSLCAGLALYMNVQKTVAEYEARERVNSRWESLIEYCMEHENAYYVVDVYSSTSYDGVSYSEKIFKNVDNSYRNFDLCGGWLSKSPLMHTKLKKMQITDIESALYTGEQAYFVAAPDKDLTWLIDYYAYKGKAIEPQRVDSIYDNGTECFIVYCIQRTDL
ncbi:MAG: hypothetical protein IJO85_02375 [Lachnospiraceae bacterium]|nr:hypothetical protein [Lachnospiraceae bacterium]